MNLHPVLLMCCLFLPGLTRAFTRDTSIHGVEVRFVYNENVFPASWRVSPINGQGESLERAEINRSGQIIARALKKYPIQVIKANLNSIYVLRSMKFYDVGYGGTNSNTEVYVTNDGVIMGYTDNYIEQTFHHEFSSVLYRNFPELLDLPAWEKSNLAGFDYNDPENGVGAIRKNQSSQELDTMLCRNGFLTQYALSGLENDINTIAQNLFTPAPGFWKIVDAFPRIYRKTLLLVEFYSRIDPSFNEAYFRRLDQ